MTRLARRRAGVVVPAVAGVLAVAIPALAFWSFAPSRTATFTAATLSPASAPAATATSPTAVSLSWTLPGSQVTGAQFVVTRTTDSLAVCTVASTVTSCTDPNTVAPGTSYTYGIKAVLSGTNWTTSTTSFSVTTPHVFAVTNASDATIGTQTAGTSFDVKVRAMKGSPLAVDTAYPTTPQTLTFSGPGAAPNGTAATVNGVAVGTPTSVTFAAGAVTLPAVLFAKTTSTSITATQGAVTGTSNTFAVSPAAHKSLSYVTTSAGTTTACTSGSVTVGNGGTFTAFVAILDQYGNLAVNGASSTTINLARTPTSGGGNAPNPTSLSVAVNANPAVTSGSFNATLPSGSPSNTTYTASSGTLTSVSCIVKKN